VKTNEDEKENSSDSKNIHIPSFPDYCRPVSGLVSAVVHLLEVMADPVARAIAKAPFDDEPVTAEEEKSLAEAREWLKHNKPIPHEQVLAELGITQEDINKFQEPK
jgi:hypothetical protein